MFKLINYFSFLFIFIVLDSNATEGLRFSNTQVLADFNKNIVKEKVKILPENWQEIIKIPVQNKNESKNTSQEIQTLLQFKKIRNEAKLKEINLERSLYGFKIGDIYLQDIFIQKELNSLKYEVNLYLREASIVVNTLKIRFDRVRPSFLEKKINPAIKIPDHPSYPSAHATQAYLLANLFSYFEPRFRDIFLRDAARISKNREIAGVHFPSDSRAGMLLANQLFSYFLNSRAKELKKLKYDIKNFLFKTY